MLKITDLTVKKENTKILKSLDLEVREGQLHILMGKNGSGKSSLAFAITGNPDFIVGTGAIEVAGEDILTLKPHERAERGVFLAFQYPGEVAGLPIQRFLRNLYNKKHQTNISPIKFKEILKEKAEELQIPQVLLDRNLNENFSGGEKKKMEILQMMLLEPKLAILDEIDSGVDIDALRTITKVINKLKEQKNMAVLLITHSTKILKYIDPDRVHILEDGKIVRAGGEELLYELEEKGFTGITKDEELLGEKEKEQDFS